MYRVTLCCVRCVWYCTGNDEVDKKKEKKSVPDEVLVLQVSLSVMYELGYTSYII